MEGVLLNEACETQIFGQGKILHAEMKRLKLGDSNTDSHIHKLALLARLERGVFCILKSI